MERLGADLDRTFKRCASKGGPLPKMRIAIGRLSPKVAAQIEKAFRRAGVKLDDEIKGTPRDVDIQEARYTYKSHGNEKSEADRGQIAITADDWALIPDITDSPDLVTYERETDQGLPGIVYWKRVNGTIYYVLQARTQQQTLSAVTMRKYKTNKLLERRLRDAEP